MKRATIVATAALLLVSGMSAFGANADYAEGQKLFAAKQYRAAATKFEAAMRAQPRDGNTIYYCALANQMCSNRVRARQLYEYITQSFPGSSLAGMASTALSQLGGAAPVSGTTGGSGSTSSVASRSSGGGPQLSGADEFRVPYEKGRSGAVYLDVQINGHPIKFHFDTGAGSTVVGANHMEEIGFGRAAQGETFKVGGVGEKQDIKSWKQNVQLRVGQAYIRDFPLTVMEDLPGEPLLGQDVLRVYETEVDPANNVVIFRKRGASKSRQITTRGTVDVPFRDQGTHMIVKGMVNNKPYEFIYDTGADGVCFSFKDLKALGIELPANAREGISHGVGGDTKTWYFTVDSMKVGTIVREDMPVSVVEKSQMTHPLLGQSFFGQYGQKVDLEKKVIHLKPNE
jgi:clan AA aspartic protease (TIGR02281 family)